MPEQLVDISLFEGKASINSLQLANNFGIKHHHMLRDIKVLVRKLPVIFTQSNFGLSEYTDSTGRSLPVYEITRDAFALLVMGYNSARAIEWKLKYIEAFNSMEQALIEVRLEGAKRQSYQDGVNTAAMIGPQRLLKVYKALEYHEFRPGQKRAFSPDATHGQSLRHPGGIISLFSQ